MCVLNGQTNLSLSVNLKSLRASIYKYNMFYEKNTNKMNFPSLSSPQKHDQLFMFLISPNQNPLTAKPAVNQFPRGII